MRVAAALLLFLASALNAQVLIDDREESYGPFEPGPIDRAAAIAVAPHGMLLVWSEVDQKTGLAVIHTGLLDFNARLVGPIHKLPTLGRLAQASNPAVITDGTNFFVAWVERDRFGQIAREVVGLLADGTGAPLKPPTNFGDPVPGAPSLIWNGLEYRLYGSKTYSISTAGEVSVYEWDEVPRRLPFASPAANGWLDWSNAPRRFFAPAVYNLDWAIISRNFTRSGRISETGYNAFAPAIVVEDDDLLFVWGDPRGLKAARIENGEAVRMFGRADERASFATPSLAGSLVVFDQLGDVYGAVITGDSIGEVFPISIGEPWDSTARVYVTGIDRYLVTWIREGNGDEIYLTGRFVTLRR